MTACWSAIPARSSGHFDGNPEVTEMDALIAYLQMLGTLVDFSTFSVDASR
jgi:cytochrome c oxidase cbb3-type subunit 2